MEFWLISHSDRISGLEQTRGPRVSGSTRGGDCGGVVSADAGGKSIDQRVAGLVAPNVLDRGARWAGARCRWSKD
jgi:hypothetical protein